MDLLTQFFPKIMGNAARAGFGAVAAIGSSTATMMSAMRSASEGRARR